MDTEAGRHRRWLAHSVADLGKSDRQEHRPNTHPADQKPQHQRGSPYEGQDAPAYQECEAAEPERKPGRDCVAEHVSTHWQEDHQLIGARRLAMMSASR